MQKEGGGETGAENAAIHGFEINTAFDLYTYLKQHHSHVTTFTMKRSTKLTSASFIIFRVEHSWLTILAGAHVLSVFDLSLTNKCSNPL